MEHANAVCATLERDAFPILGSCHIETINRMYEADKKVAGGFHLTC